jgi:hypothetical protein
MYLFNCKFKINGPKLNAFELLTNSLKEKVSHICHWSHYFSEKKKSTLLVKRFSRPGKIYHCYEIYHGLLLTTTCIINQRNGIFFTIKFIAYDIFWGIVKLQAVYLLFFIDYNACKQRADKYRCVAYEIKVWKIVCSSLKINMVLWPHVRNYYRMLPRTIKGIPATIPQKLKYSIDAKVSLWRDHLLYRSQLAFKIYAQSSFMLS